MYLLMGNKKIFKNGHYSRVLLANLFLCFCQNGMFPDYNLIELVWHSAKEYIAGRLFKSIEELELLLDQLLNEGGLIIKWGRKLKNKGNAIITV